MMTTKGALAAILVGLSFLASQGVRQTPAAGPQSDADTPSPAGTRVEYITDPIMDNMQAVAVTIPEDWHFRGRLVETGPIPAIPYFVWRATSPDGLSMVERLPQFCWAWGTGPHLQDVPRTCVHLQGPMSGETFLQNLAALLKVEYVEGVPIPPEKSAAASRAAQARDHNFQFFVVRNTAELAAATVRFQNGTFKMKGLLGGEVDCTETDYPGRRPGPYQPGGPPSAVYKCDPGIKYTVAPEDQFEAVTSVWNRPGMAGHMNSQWDYARGVRIQQWGDAQNRAFQAQFQLQQQQFQQNQATQLRMHNEFLANMQHGTDLSMARARASMNARSTSASDWVDYALNQQTVRDPGTGQLSKVSSAYSYTWVDSSGQHSYQTSDPTANPNATMPGNWTKQRVVHGDGSQ